MNRVKTNLSLDGMHENSTEALPSIYILSPCELRINALKTLCIEGNGCQLVGIEKALPTDIKRLQEISPNLVVVDMDIFSQGKAGDIAQAIDLLKQVAYVLVLASHLDIFQARIAIAHGASGYLLTSTSCQRCLHAFQLVACGGTWLEESLRAQLIQHIPVSQAEEERGTQRLLSTREHQILQKIARGETSKDIAQELYLSESSVRTYWHRVLTKLNAFSKIEAVTRAIKMGLVDPEQDFDEDFSLPLPTSSRLHTALRA